MQNIVVDLDDIETWPDRVRGEIDARLGGLISERLEERRFERSEDKWIKPWPSKPNTNRVLGEISESMKDRELRVFHATRLLDYQEVRAKGLLPLRYSERIKRLKQLAEGPLGGLSIDDIVAKADLNSPFFANRESYVYATPLRRSLHDGGCEVFFENWGGEAVQRIAETASPELARAIQRIGTPAVVVFRMPAFGFCEMGDLRLGPTMIDLALERDGSIDLSVGSWDVCSMSSVPPAWIESVLPPDDPSLVHREHNEAGSP